MAVQLPNFTGPVTVKDRFPTDVAAPNNAHGSMPRSSCNDDGVPDRAAVSAAGSS